MDKLKIALSTDPPKDIIELVKYIDATKKYIDLVHFDIMDGKFVEKTTYNYKDVEFLKLNSTLPFDVHLMVEHPEKDIKSYAKAGANMITVHYECFNNKRLLVKTLNNIKKQKCLCGLSINPNTKIEEIFEYLNLVDLVLVMSVYPGKSGQTFIEETYSRVEKLNDYRKKNNIKFLISVDGGIDDKIAPKLKMKDVDIIVSGSYIYNHQKNLLSAIMALQKLPKLI